MTGSTAGADGGAAVDGERILAEVAGGDRGGRFHDGAAGRLHRTNRRGSRFKIFRTASSEVVGAGDIAKEDRGAVGADLEVAPRGKRNAVVKGRRAPAGDSY